jgi:xanthine dehydrogenase accessory factor
MNIHTWIDGMQLSRSSGCAHVLVTIMGCAGSTPRDQGSKMVITADSAFDTIGGGQLEFNVIRQAREMLLHGGHTQQAQTIQQFPLGAALGQCCGGSVAVLFEYLPANQFQIAVFGAGHVARALIPILGTLPCRINWIDSRADEFPQMVPPNVTRTVARQPEQVLEDLDPGHDILILTHDHQLDFELCCAALSHPELRSIGLIGSATKAARFRQRLLKRGFNTEQIARIACPVGLSQVPGKLPAEVAVSIAAQLLAIEHAGLTESQRRGLDWREIKSVLADPHNSQDECTSACISSEEADDSAFDNNKG